MLPIYLAYEDASVISRRLFLASAILLSLTTGAIAQTPTTNATRLPPDYRGVLTHIPGIFVTPVPGAPFAADVQIVSHEKLPDGTERVRTTTVHVARASSGNIHNERRLLVTPAFQGMPLLLETHIYDPASRANIFLDPRTHLARQTILPRPPVAPADQRPLPSQAGFPDDDLGEQTFNDLTLKGIRKTRVVPADASGTGKNVTITDEYWYSPDLSIYVIIRHNDPRTGEQLVAVNNIVRAEPDTALFTVPSDYKLVDETPPEQAHR